ncbi:MAG: hypothetical protein A2252_07805 [Elusimicrobia bacterium RIFOXYA2_FULL_39_19]|nr:MAG: hypothetical protein A2252_07805 [Elusimicrobia bacterium RIFOXYA2_FULL_39_19]
MNRVTAVLSAGLLFIGISLATAQPIQKSTTTIPVFKKSNLSKKEISQLIEKVKSNKKERKLNEKTPYFLKIAPPYPEDKDDVLKLGITRNTECIPVLDEILTNYPSVVTRKNALGSIDLIGEKEPRLVIPVLIKALDDHNITVRGGAAHRLVKYGEKEKVLPVLIEIATIKDLNDKNFVKDIMEDEYWGSEFRVIDLWLKGDKEGIIRIHSHGKEVIKDMESDPKWVKNWSQQYQSYKEAIILGAIHDLSICGSSESIKTIEMVSKEGASENIRKEAKGLLQNIQKGGEKK